MMRRAGAFANMLSRVRLYLRYLYRKCISVNIGERKMSSINDKINALPPDERKKVEDRAKALIQQIKDGTLK